MKKKVLNLKKQLLMIILFSSIGLTGMSQYANTNYGNEALFSIASGGDSNAAFGWKALRSTTTGDYNTGVGTYALYDNVTGEDNTSIGANALRKNTSSWNTATGSFALFSNTSGFGNVANGFEAAKKTTTGLGNVGIGNRALRSNTTGSCNTGVGYDALRYNIGSSNTALGCNAGPSNNSNFNGTIAVGTDCLPTASYKARIGNTNITQIGGQVGWSVLSDGRFKKNVKKDVPGIEFIEQLNPVTYTYDLQVYNKHTGLEETQNKTMRDHERKEWTSQQKKPKVLFILA